MKKKNMKLTNKHLFIFLFLSLMVFSSFVFFNSIPQVKAATWSFTVSVAGGVGGRVVDRDGNILTYISGNVGDNCYALAVSDSGYQFDHWLAGGGSYYQNPINQPMPYAGDYTLEAILVPIAADWTLTISAGTGGTVSPTSASGASGTSTPSITATPDPGYVFSYWLLDGTTPYTETPISLTFNDALHHTLQAFFTEQQATFTLTISATPAEGGYTVPSDVVTGNVGDTVTATAYTNSGYVFDHWVETGGEVSTQNPISVTVDAAGANTLTAYFVPTSTDWTLTVSAGTGGTVSPTTASGASGTSATITATPDLGDIFSLWMLDGTTQYTQNPLTLTITDTATHTLQAFFVPISTETWDWKDDFVDQNSRWDWNYLRGATTRQLTTIDGFSVVELRLLAEADSSSYSDTSLNIEPQYSVTTDKIIIFEGRMKFSYNIGTGYAGSQGFGLFDYSTFRQIWFMGVSPESQAEFVGYRAMAGASSTTITVNQLLNIDMTQWHVYRIEISSSGIVFKVDENAVASTPSVPTGPMTLLVWNDNFLMQNYNPAGYLDVLTDQSIFIDYIAYKEAAAQQTEWTLLVSAGAGGSVSPTSATGASGTSTPAITATPNTGYTFSYWLFDGTVQYTQNPITLTIDDANSHTLEAVFVPSPTWSLTISAGTGGTVDPTSASGLPSTSTTATATPNTGYTFSYWLFDGTVQYTQNPITLTIDDANSHTLEAVFAAASTLTVTSPNGGESWARGTRHTITWTSSDSFGAYVKIELLKGGIVDRIISYRTRNDGSYSWRIAWRQIVGTDYKIRITSTSYTALMDSSDSNFAITG